MEEIIVDIGNQVICDQCNKDWTRSTVSGGFLLGSHGVCPDCSDRVMKLIEKYNEQSYIKGMCPKDVSFADWIRSIR